VVIDRGWDPVSGYRANPITLEQWLVAIEGVDGIRLCKGNPSVVNPHTGEVIEMANHGGDAEYYSKPAKEWVRAFQWSPSGRVNLNAIAFINRKGMFELHLPQQLAKKLGAKIFGEGSTVIEGDVLE
jgi:hypothetical protein